MDRLDVLKRWLRDGYAMEHQSIQVFKRDAERIVNYPELANIIQNSIALSETHAQMLQRCLNSLGGGPSVVKTTFGAAMGNIQVLIGALAADEAVKVAMFSYVHEHYKIGAYAVLVAAAEECNQPEIAKECSDALRREEGVQRELLAQINRVTRTYLTRTASGDASAKR